MTDNGDVGRLDQANRVRIAEDLPMDTDAVVLSPCAEMPSLDVIEAAESRLGLPVISAAGP